ncbi:bifunctional hydroxymethylpyrimidine kinase/phosphomethylpyrimidine kinase [Cerasicoccus arenae]|uniref:hydroxymethylpyrimidine kinase n=1 Tax=Cerasicoccus arenae TaxID=424488 RepID=A0A8J3GD81_9BACT|nr:bifunctional hydroxymethylpyrimidine kinase/phosphomethylpyrimidine kinase [Cerasicoccus arenae]MBK1856751.1 bifunctional hydroxymethylpyrimidine kinase/phosphomethylpyrimidine kinase [Cerasicoccus arenae]GHB99264.1 hydroxymethylpyrimidine/phosphomethylpyrimidine kinase [Cerasicoccus arenae]
MVKQLPVALSIATSDSGCGAGIQADLLTFAACNAYGITALAALTAQNPDGVTEIEAMSPGFLRAQLAQLAAYYPIKAAKTGMLFSSELIETAAAFIAKQQIAVVVDPVMVATSGARLLKEGAIHSLTTKLLPLATLITPNLDEAAVLLGRRPNSPVEMRASAHELTARFGTATLLKGGHLPGDELLDILALTSGKLIEIASPRIPDVDTHGSGCTLSAAITAELAKGRALTDAVQTAHAYLRRGLERPLHVAGRAFIRH